MVSIVGETWPGQTYSKIDSLSISANCSLRRVMTMRLQPPDTTDDDSKLVPCTAGSHVFGNVFTTIIYIHVKVWCCQLECWSVFYV